MTPCLVILREVAGTITPVAFVAWILQLRLTACAA